MTIAAAVGRWHDFFVLLGTTSATLLGLLVTAAMGSWRLLLVLGLWRHTPPDGFDEREREARTQG